ncbi:uncharacterized protein LACBIDRAFT_306662 [Laccaria bicolor S238N-H82]|uniref:Predicted protein n=1 Tax=Laccaria bicolor (strain S238N-H82 / ATCC MYA-4686) TaxID=486041 RepID=B0DNI4_LACBS|nr:uncharacterized protein LACBIDRAFT_306662 [Laccaria bicolor S238N-H82]EDR03943.1 predicted protein [Laccaria bicolor S238N-H82]|eukprot:XP_001885511.1 predicted protein [Laccaria bicolor S238N-H82]
MSTSTSMAYPSSSSSHQASTEMQPEVDRALAGSYIHLIPGQLTHPSLPKPTIFPFPPRSPSHAVQRRMCSLPRSERVHHIPFQPLMTMKIPFTIPLTTKTSPFTLSHSQVPSPRKRRTISAALAAMGNGGCGLCCVVTTRELANVMFVDHVMADEVENIL